MRFVAATKWLKLFLISVLALGALTPSVVAQDYVFNISSTSASTIHRVVVPISQSVSIQLSEPVGNAAVANPAIADIQPITDRDIYVVGKSLGRTSISLYSPDNRPLGLIEVEVGVDAADIRRAIHDVAPRAAVKVSSVNGRVRLSGEVSDGRTMAKIIDVVNQYGSDAIVNGITLKGGQQVNLEVRILEASRNAGRDLGINWRFGQPAVNTSGEIIGIAGGIGSSAGAVGGTFLNGTDSGLLSAGKAMGVGPGGSASFATFIANVISSAVGINLDVIINAMEAKGVVRTLATPNLTTLSGQEAEFLAGGKVPVRTIDANGDAALSYQEIGVKLRFTPIVLEDARIQIQLSPEVNELVGYTPSQDPIFASRNLSTNIELRDGQSFSVAGLLQSDNRKVQQQIPWIGQIPVLGALFRSSSYAKKETELVIIVTPRLVRPSMPGQVAATPLDKTLAANDIEFFLMGQLEVTKDMVRDYEQGIGIAGPFGHILTLTKDKMVYAKH